MIVVVKRVDYKKLAIKVLTILGLALMLGAYYLHMSDFYSNFGESPTQNPTEQQSKVESDKKEKKAKAIEAIIYDEALVATSLLGQENLIDLKISNDRLLIITNPSVDLEPVMIRYGVLALVQNTKNDVKIAVDLASIVQSRYIEDDE